MPRKKLEFKPPKGYQAVVPIYRVLDFGKLQKLSDKKYQCLCVSLRKLLSNTNGILAEIVGMMQINGVLHYMCQIPLGLEGVKACFIPSDLLLQPQI